MICSGVLFLLSASGSRYQLDWASNALTSSDIRKIAFVNQCVGRTEVPTPDDLKQLLASLYQTNGQGAPHETELKQQLIRSILRKAVADRRELKAESASTSDSLRIDSRVAVDVGASQSSSLLPLSPVPSVVPSPES